MKRRDITFGNIKTLCKRTTRNDLSVCKDCIYGSVCRACGFVIAPAFWDLTDPTRFNEAQMAFWRGLHAIGINFVMLADDGLLLRMAESRQADSCTMIAVLIEIKLGLSKGEELDLAELFGKDGAE